MIQASPPRTLDVGRVGQRVTGARAAGAGEALRAMSYLPFLPPNVAGFPKGDRLGGPHNFVHGLDLLQAAGPPPTTKRSVSDLFASFGVFDVSDSTRDVVSAERDHARRFSLAAASPELMLV